MVSHISQGTLLNSESEHLIVTIKKKKKPKAEHSLIRRKYLELFVRANHH